MRPATLIAGVAAGCAALLLASPARATGPTSAAGPTTDAGPSPAAGPTATAGPQPAASAAQASVDREFALAAREIDRLNVLLQAELARVMSGSAEAPSPEIAKLMSTGAAKPALGDTSVPLHLRLIERKRLELAAAVNWARGSAGHCGDPQFGPPQLVDPEFREHVHAVLKCRRAELDRYQTGMHKLNKDREASVPALKLPVPVQERMSAQAREATRQQDASLEPVYRNRRAIFDAIDNLFTFMDSHPAQFLNNRIQFENDADRFPAQALIDRFTEAARLPQ